MDRKKGAESERKGKCEKEGLLYKKKKKNALCVLSSLY